MDMASSWTRPVLVVGLTVFALVRLVRFITRSALLPSSLIGRNVQQLDQFVLHSRVHSLTRVSVPVAQGVALDACIIGTGSAWLIYSNANGVCYEHILPYVELLGRVMRRRVLVYNYRGVGRSQGGCERAEDMVDDLVACVRYVESQQQQSGRDIVLWGHSIGGAVSVLAADRLKGSIRGVVSDRSFGNLSDVVQAKLQEGPLGAILFGLVSSAAFAALVVVAAQLGVLPGLQEAEDSAGGGGGGGLLRVASGGIAAGWFASRLGLLPVQQVRMFFAGGAAVQFVLGELVIGAVVGTGNSNNGNTVLLPCATLWAFVCGYELASTQRFGGAVLGGLQQLVVWQGWNLHPSAVILEGSPLVCTSVDGDEMIPAHLGLHWSSGSSNSSKGGGANKKPQRWVELDGPSRRGGGGEQAHMYALSESEIRQVERALLG